MPAHQVLLIIGLSVIPAVEGVGRGEPGKGPPEAAAQAKKVQERASLRAEVSKLRAQGKLDEAVADAQKLVALDHELFGTTHTQLAASLQLLAELHGQRGNFPAAREAAKERLHICTELYGGRDWRVTDAQLALQQIDLVADLKPEQRRRLAEADELARQVISLHQQGKFREAIEPTRQVVSTRKDLFGEAHPQYASALSWLALQYSRLGESGQAEPLYRRILQIQQRGLGEAHPETKLARQNLAITLEQLAAKSEAGEDFTATRKYREEALAQRTQLHGAGHWRTTDARLALAYLGLLERLDSEGRRRLREADAENQRGGQLFHEGKYAQAVKLVQSAAETRKMLLGVQHVRYADALLALGELYREERDYARALPLLEQARDIRTRTLGEQHPLSATPLRALADLYWSQGDYARALPLYEQVRDIYKRTLGEQDPLYADTLLRQGGLFQAQGDYARALPLLKQARDITKRAVGEQHLGYANVLDSLGGLYQAQGDYAKALPLLEQARDITKRTLGEQNVPYAGALNNLARLYQARGDYARALPLYEQVRDIRKRALGEQDPLYADTLLRQGGLFQAQGDYARALPLLKQARDITKRTLGEQHPDYATALDSLGVLYQSQGDYTRAMPLLEQARDIRKRAVGEQNVPYAGALNNLARLYQARGDYARALPLYEQARDIFKRVLGEQHPDYATALTNLAELYCVRGDYAQAETFLLQALGVRKKGVGESHRDYARALSSLADLYRAQGDYAKALPLLEQARDITKRTLGEQHPDYATALDSLGVLYQSQGDYTRAMPLLEQARDITKRALGEKHLHYAAALNNLARLYQAQGDYAKALPLHEQARDIRKQALGEQNPYYAESLHNLAAAYEESGDFGKALPLLGQAREITERAVGEQHPNYAIALSNLAFAELAQGHPAEAAQQASRAVTLSRRLLAAAALAQSERQQLAHVQKARGSLDAWLAVSGPAGLGAEECYAPALAWKGAVSARQLLTRGARRVLAAKGDTEAMKAFAELEEVSRDLATLALATPPEDGRTSEVRRQLQELSDRQERLEGRLAGLSAAFRRTYQPPSPAVLRQALPKGAALVDLLEYAHQSADPKAVGRQSVEQRLVAFVVTRESVTRVDLGAAKAVSEAAERWLLTMKRTRPITGADDPGVRLRRLLWEPLEKHLSGAQLVLLSPDGVTARLPFAALPGKAEGNYLLEEVPLAILPVPRLLPALLGSAGPAEPSLLVVGEVDYDADPGAPRQRAAARTAAGRERAGQPGKWEQLKATAAEVEAIKDCFWRSHRQAAVTELRRDEPTEEAVRQQAIKHAYLHLATHGFFAPPPAHVAADGRGGEGLGLFSRPEVTGLHPDLLCGLVLAGANKGPQLGRDDGVLTALEVAGLDLSGCELAVLSACETALGKQTGGEGLLGLQRAFQAAGARSVVASLWSVPDEATRALMERFYRNLWERKVPRLVALREAQLWLLKEGPSEPGVLRGMRREDVPPPEKGGRLPPYYWGAFVLSGDWR
jgi:tetratricopeptide (TPR) repeat protein/CHAT domain-containing protein